MLLKICHIYFKYVVNLALVFIAAAEFEPWQKKTFTCKYFILSYKDSVVFWINIPGTD